MSLLTKLASGYWHVADSQSGYTAINLRALETIDWDKMYKKYGQPNDLLVRLNIYSFRVRDVPIEPVYGIGEKSGVKPFRMIPRLSWLLFRLFFYRMGQKYVIRVRNDVECELPTERLHGNLGEAQQPHRLLT